MWDFGVICVKVIENAGRNGELTARAGGGLEFNAMRRGIDNGRGVMKPR